MLSELGKEKTHYHKRRGLNENVMSKVPFKGRTFRQQNGFGEVPNVSEPFLTTTILWIFKPSQFYEAYPLTLIPCRKGNWLHVGSTPTASTHSRIATLIVGRNGRAYDGSGVATAKRSHKRVSKLPMVEVELFMEKATKKQSHQCLEETNFLKTNRSYL